jgi:hypothetical protein
MIRLLVLFLLTMIPATLAADVESHDGHGGVWLRGSAAEVFVATEPRFRVLSFRARGQSSLLADSKTNEQGLRLAFMEPEQIPASFDVGNQRARVVHQEARRVSAELEPAAGLRYDVAVELADDEPRLELSYTLTNVGHADRQVACWSLISFALDGTIVVPFGENDRALRRLVLPWWTKWPQPNVAVARAAMTVDASRPIEGNACKIGLVTEPGWIGFARAGSAIISTVVHAPGKTYPEGGANITLYLDKNRCETEQVGPLTLIGPGESVTMRESLRLVPFTPAAPDPDALAKALSGK